MAQRKLGRGLGALVEIPPALGDGTARVHEALRDSRDVSVLALSGQSVEDFFRAPAPAPNVVLRSQEVVLPSHDVPPPAPEPAPPQPATTMSPPYADDDARGDQYLLFDAADNAAVEAAVEAEAAEAAEAPAAPAEPVDEPADAECAVIDDVYFDDAVFAEPAPVVVETPAEQVPAPPPAEPVPAQPPAEPEPPPQPEPTPAFEDDVLFLDESVGGIVLPDVVVEDVELE